MDNMEIKVQKYTELVLNQKKLIKASRSIIRKRKSPLARKIQNGNVSAIVKAATNRICSNIPENKRKEICKILCDLKEKTHKSVSCETNRQLISYAIRAIIALIDTTTGIITTLLWIVRGHMYEEMCPCKLTGTCRKNVSDEELWCSNTKILHC